eukprot:comp12307_c0_seq1/m.7149 comp12307_c0_seq1/g.7149  ORF comp12307_c0_seq1/g.7149 comp12307_c0_seq1/m.7149 type:complete len:337 (-) comp12307_c0_seq1:706-1716(-)
MLLSAAFIFGLSLFKDLKRLGFVSKASTLLYIPFTYVLLSCAMARRPVNESLSMLLSEVPTVRLAGFHTGFPITIFAFNLHHALFMIRKELGSAGKHGSSSRQMTVAMVRACTALFLFYSMVGVVGLAIKGQYTDGNILNSIPVDFPLASAMKLAFVLCLLTTAPLNVLPARDCIVGMYTKEDDKESILPTSTPSKATRAQSGGGRPKTLSISLDEGDKKSGQRVIVVRCVVSFVFVTTAIVLATVASSLQVILGLCSAFCGIPLSHALPAYFYLKVVGKTLPGPPSGTGGRPGAAKPLDRKREKMGWWLYTLAWGLLVVAVDVATITIYSALYPS